MTNQVEQCHFLTASLDCEECGEEIDPPERALILKIKTCKSCGDKIAKQVRRTVAPLNKSNYYLITNIETLKQLNPKRTI